MRLTVLALLLLVPGASVAATKLFPERQPQCLACHGDNGASEMPETPSLGGMPEFYTLLQLVAFRDGDRKSDIMRDMVRGMTDDDLRAAASFVAKQPRPAPPAQAGDPAKMERGKALMAKGRCMGCHGPQLLGGEQMPPLKHQREDYLLKSLADYKASRRVGDRAAMVEIVTPLKDEDLADLAHYLAHMPN